ncbi:MAG: DUF2892 domain-containing protein [Prolixibacteraceae bacterium]|jgi:hypothetical protein|nr:DUF2892 domain-containing protein [Prolixibacteraceae bacterium]
MKCNVGTTDRIIRIVLGLVIVVLGVYFSSWWGLIGIIPLATGLFKWCPLYIPFKISTVCKDKTL